MSLGGVPKISKNNKEYRDNLAKDLNGMRKLGDRGRAAAKELLSYERNKDQYKEADREIKEKRQERLSEIKDEKEKEAKLRELSKRFDVTNSSEKSEKSNEYQEKFSNFVKRVDDFCDGLVNKSSPIIKEMKREIIEFFDPSLQNGDTDKINSFYRKLKKDLLKNADSVTENAKKEFREYLESLSTESKIPDFLRQVNNFSENIEDEINKRLVRNLNNILMDINANLGTLYENKDLTKDQKSKKVIGYIDSYIV